MSLQARLKPADFGGPNGPGAPCAALGRGRPEALGSRGRGVPETAGSAFGGNKDTMATSINVLRLQPARRLFMSGLNLRPSRPLRGACKPTCWRSYCRHQPSLNESKMSKPRSVVILGAGVVHLNESKMSKPRSAKLSTTLPKKFSRNTGTVPVRVIDRVRSRIENSGDLDACYQSPAVVDRRSSIAASPAPVYEWIEP